MINIISRESIIGGVAWFIALFSMASPSLAISPADAQLQLPSDIKDQPIDDYRKQLLQMAFEAASMIPLYPHIKDRARLQEQIVGACLDLDQPVKALRYSKEIPNWRRGAAYADVAIYCAKHDGSGEGLQPILDRATVVAQNAGQDWRVHHVKVKIAQVHALLGRDDKATEMGTDVVDSEQGKVETIQAMRDDAEAFNRHSELLDKLIESEVFDRKQNALTGYVRLFGRHYEHADRRAKAEKTVIDGMSNMPIFLRIEWLVEMASHAADHNDRQKAVDLLNQAQTLMDHAEWRLRFELPLRARLIKVQYRLGDEEGARNAATTALARFKADPAQITNIWRAESLRPFAEVYAAMGDREAAQDVYRLVLEQAVINPNSRPRAEDLAETCLSMARAGVKPDEALWAQIAKVKRNLSDPW